MGLPPPRAAGLALVVGLVLAACADGARVAAPARHLALTLSGIPVRVRVARTPAERSAGLAGVAHLAADEGMLFVYPRPGVRRFWMRGCLVPLDIAFLDGDRRVLQVRTLAPPADGHAPAATACDAPCALVLELPGGFFARHGVGVGARLEVPPTATLPPGE